MATRLNMFGSIVEYNRHNRGGFRWIEFKEGCYFWRSQNLCHKLFRRCRSTVYRIKFFLDHTTRYSSGRLFDQNRLRPCDYIAKKTFVKTSVFNKTVLGGQNATLLSWYFVNNKANQRTWKVGILRWIWYITKSCRYLQVAQGRTEQDSKWIPEWKWPGDKYRGLDLAFLGYLLSISHTPTPNEVQAQLLFLGLSRFFVADKFLPEQLPDTFLVPETSYMHQNASFFIIVLLVWNDDSTSFWNVARPY